MSDYLWPHNCSTPCFPVLQASWSLLKLMSIESVMPSNHLICGHIILILLQSFPASGSFLVSWLFASGGQNIGAAASASVLPMSIQGWLSLALTGLISLKSKGLSTPQFKALILQHSAFFMVQLSHPYMPTGKTIALTIQTSVVKVMSLLFNTLSRFVKAFLQEASVF